MKRFLTTAATALVLSTNAYAAAHMAQVGAYEVNAQSDFFASDLIGMRIYATEAEMDGEFMQAGAEQEWDDIGEINDLIVSKDGTVQAVILGIGGFLGIGERDIAIAMSDIKVRQEEGEEAGDFFLVVNTNKEALEAAPQFERKMSDDAAMPADGAAKPADGAAKPADGAEMKPADGAETKTDSAMATGAAAGAAATGANADAKAEVKTENSDNVVVTEGDKTADSNMEKAAENMEKAAENTGQAMENAADKTGQAMENAADNTEKAVDNAAADTNAAATGTIASTDREMLTQPTIEREGFKPVPVNEINTDELDNAVVYGVNDERIGEVDRLLLNEGGQAEQAVINVGGFLGLGEKPVAVTFDELRIMQASEGGELRVYIDATEEQLKAQPKYEETK